MFCLTDRAEIIEVSDAGGGRLVVNARVARGGNVQEYLGSEMGVKDKHIVRVYRPADEVFDKQSMSTFPHKFVTLDHPPMPSTFDKDAVGWIGDEVARDGDFIRVPMTIAHSKAIQAVRGKDGQPGKRELSVGYGCEIEFRDGVSPAGEQYDAVMTNITVDHVAIVDRARGGSQLRIGDWRDPDLFDQRDNLKEPTMTDVKTQTVLVDGLSVLTTDAGAQAITLLQGKLKDADTAKAALVADHAKALAAKDAALAKKDAELDDLKAKVLSDADMDKRVKERADLIGTAKSIHDADYTGKSDAEIRKAVVSAKRGAESIADKSQAYIDAAFDILAEDAAKGGNDSIRKVLIQGADTHRIADNGYSASVNDLDYRTRNLKKEA